MILHGRHRSTLVRATFPSTGISLSARSHTILNTYYSENVINFPLPIIMLLNAFNYLPWHQSRTMTDDSSWKNCFESFLSLSFFAGVITFLLKIHVVVRRKRLCSKIDTFFFIKNKLQRCNIRAKLSFLDIIPFWKNIIYVTCMFIM